MRKEVSNMTTVHETLDTPVLGSYDVIVCGGGIAGISAAVAAARNGASVLLLEKTISLGGLATIGLISWYEPLCDGKGTRVMNGIAFELLKLATRYGFHTLAKEWSGQMLHAGTDRRLATHFSHSMFAMALDEWLLGAGVTLLLDTVVTAPLVRDGHIEGLFTENKDGRSFYRAGVVIDATGDADIAYRSGVPCEDGVNYLTFIGYRSDLESASRAAQDHDIGLVRRWENSGADLWGRGHPEGLAVYRGISAEGLTDFVVRGRRALFQRARDEDAFSRDYSVLPAMPQFRKTRRIIGRQTLRTEDAGVVSPSAIGTVPDFFNRGAVYEIPYETLYSSEIDNLYAAGRCISSTGWAWDVTRVIPGAAATGQAAGTAAALCISAGCGNGGISVSQLQRHLSQDGVWIHCGDGGPEESV